MIETKICIKCGNELGVEMFGKAINVCKACKVEYKRKWYIENRAWIVERRKKYREVHKEDKSEYDKKYQEKNKDRIVMRRKEYYKDNKVEIHKKHKEYWIKYYKENKEKILRNGKKYRNDNPEYMKMVIKKWAQKNSDRVNVKTNRRRAKIRLLPNSLTVEQWNEVKIYFHNECCYCGKEQPLEQEHLIPISRGGEYTLNNIIASCRSCNASKSDKLIYDWYPNQPFYSKEREKAILTYLGYKNGIQQLALM